MPLAPRAGAYVGNKSGNALDVVSISRSAKAHNDEPFGWHDDDVLPEGAARIKGIAWHAQRSAEPRTLAVTEIGPESGAHTHPCARRERGRITYPSLRQDAPAADDSIVEIEQAKTCPVARRRQHLARSLRRARRVQLPRDAAHAQRLRELTPRKAQDIGGVTARRVADQARHDDIIAVVVIPGAAPRGL